MPYLVIFGRLKGRRNPDGNSMNSAGLNEACIGLAEVSANSGPRLLGSAIIFRTDEARNEGMQQTYGSRW